MPVTKYGSTKRYGARYGRSIKEKLGKVEVERKKKQACPYCAKSAVVRRSTGIWFCKHCNAEFTGFAYSVSKKSVLEQRDHSTLEVEEQEPEEENYQEESEEQ